MLSDSQGGQWARSENWDSSQHCLPWTIAQSESFLLKFMPGECPVADPSIPSSFWPVKFSLKKNSVPVVPKDLVSCRKIRCWKLAPDARIWGATPHLRVRNTVGSLGVATVLGPRWSRCSARSAPTCEVIYSMENAEYLSHILSRTCKLFLHFPSSLPGLC